MATCASCGNEVAEGVNFCEHCGQAMDPEGFTAYEVKDPSTGPLYNVHIGQYIRKGWEIFLQYPAGFIGFNLIFMIANGILSMTERKLPVIIPYTRFLEIVAISRLYIGLCIVSAKLLQRQPCRFSDFFSGFHFFKPLVIFGLIFSLFYVIIGELGNLILPYKVLFWLSGLASLAFGLVFLFTPFIVVDRRLGLWKAMELSRQTVQRRWLQILGFLCLAGLIAMAGVIVLGVGLLVTVPLFYCIITAAYADLFGLQSKEY
jgi:hypothetical protein